MNIPNQDKYQQLKADIQESGIMSPVLVSKNGVVLDGLHRTLIARELGIQVPVIRLNVEVTHEDPNNLQTWIDEQPDKGAS